MKAKLYARNLEVELKDDGRLSMRSNILPFIIERFCAKSVVALGNEDKTISFEIFDKNDISDSYLSVSSESEGLKLDISFNQVEYGILIKSKLTNLRSEELKFQKLCPIFARNNMGSIKLGNCDPFELVFFKNGWQSWSATYPIKVGEPEYSPHTRLLRLMQEDVTRPSAGRVGEHFSDMVTFIHDPISRATLVIGFVDTANYFGEISIVADEAKIVELVATLLADGIVIFPNTTLEIDALFISLTESDEFALERWAEICAKRMKARVSAWIPKGWCSWYYYFNRINETILRENLDVLGDVRKRLGLEVFLIDDGYQKTCGDWLELNRKFSSDLKTLADTIKSEGFIAGIWIAPFIATSRSNLFSKHPDWFLKDEKDKPVWAGLNPLWRANFYALDPTHPEVQSYLEGVFRKMLAAGFEYFKLDFLYAAALNGKSQAENLTRAQRLRQGLEFIRSILGDKFILGCGCPLGPAIGLVDAMRVGPDVAAFWGEDPLRKVMRDQHALCAKNAIRNSINRAFMHRRLWLNDSDCVIVRRNKSRLSLDEVKCLCATAISTSGLIFFSDNFEKLDSERISILEKTFHNIFSESHVISPASYDSGVIITGKIDNKKAISVLNPSDEPKFVSIRFDKFGISSSSLRELFSNEVVRSFGGAIEIPQVPPHGAVVLMEEFSDE